MMFTIKRLADVAGVTVRTLQYYDQIGLLKPVVRNNHGYRYYDHDAVITLQQILFFRELDFSLGEIKTILTRPDFDVNEALKQHRQLLLVKKERIDGLLTTIDKTIKGGSEEVDMEINEYYEGFSDEQVEKYRSEVRRRWGNETLEESEARVIKMGKDRFVDVQAEGGRIFKTVFDNMSEGYDSVFIQKQIELWRQWLENFHHYSDEEVLGLGRVYSQSPDFVRFFEQYDKNLSVFLTKSIEYYISDNSRKNK